MKPLKILVADDVTDNAEILNIMLGRLGHQVVTASDAPTAEQLALEHAPDVVFMDIVMPGAFDGLEAIRRLRQRHGFRGIIVCQTAQASPGNVAEALTAGADTCLTKPFKYKDVLSLIERYTVSFAREG